ncbi:hypothetical protein DSO57_1018187 [Entomophthora muscae]|uniref:Uncharacterized protein n=1 Tax=Entomophthora muscae TaxID=34485 RepID=A0ACC2RIX4_9FUNG|nr:hypothetical protein DSO57_1018187 [Entomophthora muscae]
MLWVALSLGRLADCPGHSGPWLYLFKLVPILWWALPTWPATCPDLDSDRLAAQRWFPEIMIKYFNPGNLSPKMLIIIGASCIMTKNLLSFVKKNFNSNEPKKDSPTAELTKGLSSQVQIVIFNQFITKVKIPHMSKTTLKEDCRAMPVLCLHFQSNPMHPPTQ